MGLVQQQGAEWKQTDQWERSMGRMSSEWEVKVVWFRTWQWRWGDGHKMDGVKRFLVRRIRKGLLDWVRGSWWGEGTTAKGGPWCELPAKWVVSHYLYRSVNMGRLRWSGLLVAQSVGQPVRMVSVRRLFPGELWTNIYSPKRWLPGQTGDWFHPSLSRPMCVVGLFTEA